MSEINNQNIIYPLTKAAYVLGYSMKGLYRLSKKDGFDGSYEMFMQVSQGKKKHEWLENWFREKGFGPELSYAQELQKKQESKKEARGETNGNS